MTLAALSLGWAAAMPATAEEPARPPASVREKAGPAQGTPDAALQAKLDELKLKYQMGENGDFKLIFEVEEGGRSQLVFLQSEMEEYGGLKIREIWSPVMKIQGDLDQKLANQLLLENQQRKLGAWQLLDLKGENLLSYAVKVPDPKTTDELFALIYCVMLSADEMEKKLTGKDEY